MLTFTVIISGICMMLISSKLRRRRCVVLKQHYRKLLQHAERCAVKDQADEDYRSLNTDNVEEGQQAE